MLVFTEPTRSGRRRTARRTRPRAPTLRSDRPARRQCRGARRSGSFLGSTFAWRHASRKNLRCASGSAPLSSRCFRAGRCFHFFMAAHLRRSDRLRSLRERLEDEDAPFGRQVPKLARASNVKQRPRGRARQLRDPRTARSRDRGLAVRRRRRRSSTRRGGGCGEARWTATSDDEQAVSTARLGPSMPQHVRDAVGDDVLLMRARARDKGRSAIPGNP